MNLNAGVDNILMALDQIPNRAVTVFGDYALDKYLYINADRNEPSLETGLTAYQVERKHLLPGVGGTVTNNLRALGACVHCVGLVGDDGEGYELLKGLRDIGAGTDLMVRSEKVMTATYIKPMLGSESEPYAEINRMDIRSASETPSDIEDQLLANLEQALKVSEGVVVTDQFLERNCSAVTGRIRRELAGIAKRFPDKIFYADSRGFAGDYRDVIIKCNRFEMPGADSESAMQEEDEILAGGKSLLSANGRAAVVTAGAGGAYVFEGEDVIHIPAYEVEGPIDIVGAGDATNAGIILGLTLGLALPEAVLLGSCISSITIQQVGVTGTATVAKAKERLLQYAARAE